MLCVFILPVGFCYKPDVHKIDTFCDKVTFGFFGNLSLSKI